MVPNTRALEVAWGLRSLVSACRAHIDGNAGEPIFEVLEGGEKVKVTDDLSTHELEQLAYDLPKRLKYEVLTTLLEFSEYMSDAVNLAALYLFAKKQAAVEKEFLDAVSEAHSACGRRLLHLAAKCQAWWRINCDGKPIPDEGEGKRGNILEAMTSGVDMSANEISKKAGWKNNSHFRATLANLVRTGQLVKGSEGKGYRKL